MSINVVVTNERTSRNAQVEKKIILTAVGVCYSITAETRFVTMCKTD